MVRVLRRFLYAIGLLVLAARASFAQAPPADSSQFGGFPSPDWNVMKHNTAVVDTLDDRNGSALIGDPLLDRPNIGWFATAEIDLMSAHVHSELADTVVVGGKGSVISLPMATMNWTAAPRIELGYRFGEAAGELLVTYRFVSTSGSESTPDFAGTGTAGSLQSRFDLNVIDLDYGSQEISLLPWMEMKWRVGVRIADVFFDSQESNTLVAERVSNYFVGAGPHATLDLACPLVPNRVGLFFRLDGAEVFGTVHQEFAENETTPAGTLSGYTSERQFMSTTMMNVQAGVTYTPSSSWRMSIGYTYEHWWDATFTVAGRGDLWTQGLYFRSEWKF